MAYALNNPARGWAPLQIAYNTRGALSRRIVAYLLDLLFVGLFMALLSAAALFITIISFGLLHVVWALPPLTALIYATLTVGGSHSATWGMRITGLRYHRLDGLPVRHADALVVTILFYLSVALTGGLILLLPIFTSGHRTLHDILSGLVLARSDPSQRF